MCCNSQTRVKYIAVYSAVQAVLCIVVGIVALLLHECILFAERRADPIGSFIFNFFYQFFYDKRKCLSKGHDWATIETYPGGRLTRTFQVQGWFIGYIADNTLWLAVSMILLIGYKVKFIPAYYIFILVSSLTVAYDLVLVIVFAMDIEREMGMIHIGIESTGREFLTNTIIMTVFSSRFVIFLLVNIYCIIAVHSATKQIKLQKRQTKEKLHANQSSHLPNPAVKTTLNNTDLIRSYPGVVPKALTENQQRMIHNSVQPAVEDMTRQRPCKSIPNLPVLKEEPRNLKHQMGQNQSGLRSTRSYDSLNSRRQLKPAPLNLLQYDSEPRARTRSSADDLLAVASSQQTKAGQNEVQQNLCPSTSGSLESNDRKRSLLPFSYLGPRPEEFQQQERMVSAKQYAVPRDLERVIYAEPDENATNSESNSTYPKSTSDEDNVIYENINTSRSNQSCSNLYENLPLLKSTGSKSNLKKHFSSRKKMKSVSFSKIPTSSDKAKQADMNRSVNDTTGSGDEVCTEEFFIFNYNTNYSQQPPIYASVSKRKKDFASSPDLVFDPVSEKVQLVFKPSYKRNSYAADETAF